MDLVSYGGKHNEANGEENRDGHNENHSWNNGAEGEDRLTPISFASRRDDMKALLSTLFATRGSIMLTAGDEAGRSQRGNNNAYCQDNEITWMDWAALDEELIAHTAFIAGLRSASPSSPRRASSPATAMSNGYRPHGRPMSVLEWETPNFSTLGMVLSTRDGQNSKATRLAVLFNRSGGAEIFTLPGSCLMAASRPRMRRRNPRLRSSCRAARLLSISKVDLTGLPPAIPCRNRHNPTVRLAQLLFHRGNQWSRKFRWRTSRV